jgi:hypothetical protein
VIDSKDGMSSGERQRKQRQIRQQQAAIEVDTLTRIFTTLLATTLLPIGAFARV